MIHAPLPNSQETKRLALRKKRNLATGLLVFAGIVLVATLLVPAPGFWVLLLRAAAEAAIVGGLADWFAVTALFRRPLGLPIPHTALIPSRKDEIGRTLGSFVAEQFLDPALLTARLRSANRAAQLAGWLDTEETAEFIGKRIVEIVPLTLHSLDDAEIHRFLRSVAAEAFRRIEIVPVVDALIDDALRSGKHMVLVDIVAELLEPALQALKAPIIEKVGERTGRFFPSYFDRKIGTGIVAGAQNWLDAVRVAGSEERRQLDGWIKDMLADLRASSDYQKLLEQTQKAILDNPTVLAALSALWDKIKRELIADTASASPRIGIIAAEIVRTIGRQLQQMPVVQDYLNIAILRVLVDYIAPWRIQIGNYIADVVAGWDGPRIAETIELQVGGDLQYIRINGTIVGALIGMALFLAGAAIG